MLERARARHGIMARLARSSWGLEVGVLRTAHTALLTSMVRYALVTVGSGAYEAHLQRLETQHANISARRITGISRSARLMTLHMCADVRLVRNLYTRQCALLLDRALRASSCSLQTRMLEELRREYQMRCWDVEMRDLALPARAGVQAGVQTGVQAGVQTGVQTGVGACRLARPGPASSGWHHGERC